MSAPSALAAPSYAVAPAILSEPSLSSLPSLDLLLLLLLTPSRSSATRATLCPPAHCSHVTYVGAPDAHHYRLLPLALAAVIFDN